MREISARFGRLSLTNLKLKNEPAEVVAVVVRMVENDLKLRQEAAAVSVGDCGTWKLHSARID